MARCLACGNEFEAVRATAKFCSVSCKSSFHRGVSVPEPVSVSPVSVSEASLSVSEKVSVSDDDVGTPARVLDLVKDLHLDLGRDLGCTAWTQDGIFIKPDITYTQIQNIARLVAAKHGRPAPVFRQQGV